MESYDVVIADIVGQALDIFLHGPDSAHKNGIVKTFTHTSIPIHPCTVEKKKKKKKRKMLCIDNHVDLEEFYKISRIKYKREDSSSFFVLFCFVSFLFFVCLLLLFF